MINTIHDPPTNPAPGDPLVECLRELLGRERENTRGQRVMRALSYMLRML
jgi:hypothetical protein